MGNNHYTTIAVDLDSTLADTPAIAVGPFEAGTIICPASMTGQTSTVTFLTTRMVIIESFMTLMDQLKYRLRVQPNRKHKKYLPQRWMELCG